MFRSVFTRILLSLLFIPCQIPSKSSILARERPPFDPLRPYPSEFVAGTGDLRQVEPILLDNDTLNIKINSDDVEDIHNEEQVWVNPTNPENIVAVWRDFRLHYRRVAYGYSFDGGMTWTDALFDEPSYEKQSDPGLTVDSEGNYYAVLLDYSDDLNFNGLFVLKSTDGGVTWSDPVAAVDSVWGAFEDKELIACDRTGGSSDGNLYVSWTRFWEAQIFCASSRDGGQSFDEAVMVSEGGNAQWSEMAVGMNGELYVAWVGYDQPGIYYDMSYDEGRTFEGNRLLTEVVTPDIELNGGILTFSYPVLDADLTDGIYQGTIYLVYMDMPYGDADIFFRSSLDGGITWSDPIRVNDDAIGNGADQFHPWMSIDEEGNIIVVFYDRRLDVPDNYMMDVFMTVSMDRGQTFFPNGRVTTVSSDPRAGQGYTRAGLIGEYIGVSARNGVAHPVWTDTRTGHQEVWTAAVDYSGLGIEYDNGAIPLPRTTNLLQNFPNPFNPTTTISFDLEEKMPIELSIYDVRGRRVRRLMDEIVDPGHHRITWDGKDECGDHLPSGVYLYRLVTGGQSVSRKMLLLK
jgi:hypothetical protein